MKLIKNTEKKLFAGITDTRDWEDGRVELSTSELEIVRKAFLICDRADEMTKKARHDIDDFNSYGEASNALFSILELYQQK